MVKPEYILPRNVIQQRYRKRNPQQVRETNKRMYLEKKAAKYGKDYLIVDKWMKEWKRTGKVSYVE